jgi:MFS family permease
LTEAAPPPVSQPVGPASPPSTFSVFRKRDFRLLWSAQLVSTIGTALTDLAAGILVFRQTGSALSVGLMFMAVSVPTLLVGLIAGVCVDRYDRRRIMVVSDLLRAAIVVAIPFLITINIVLRYVAVALVSAISQFFNPANDAVLPEVATEEELAAANSWIMISSFGSTSVGFALSGLLAASFAIEWAFYLDAVTFLISAACLVWLRIGKITTDEETSVGVVLANLRDGVRTLIGTPILRSLFLVSAPVYLAFGLWNVLLLPFSQTALHAGEFVYGLQEGLTSVGFVIGSLLMARWAERYREGSWIVVTTVLMGVAGIVYGLSTSIPIAILLVMVSGFLNAPGSIARRLVLQRSTPREMRGRVFSAFAVLRDVMFLVGISMAGLADVIDVRLLILIAMSVLVVAGLWTGIMPGLGRPAGEWRRAVAALRAARAGAAVPAGAFRQATLADFDRLAGHLPALARLSDADRRGLVGASRVRDVAAGETVVSQGEVGDAADFILDGRTVAGSPEPGGGYRSLSSMTAGDFFGEIAALTGSQRTATVVAEVPTTLIEVPSAALRSMMAVPELSSVFLAKVAERLNRTREADLPRFSGVDQASLKDLRTPRPSVEALPKTY